MFLPQWEKYSPFGFESRSGHPQSTIKKFLSTLQQINLFNCILQRCKVICSSAPLLNGNFPSLFCFKLHWCFPYSLGQHSTPFSRGMSLVAQRGQFYANAACSPFLFCILACLPVFPPQNCIFIPPHFGEGDEGETSQQKRLDTNN